MPRLGVNIDHCATLRQARGGRNPDPILAAQICLKAGAHGITCHLREDRRHIQDRDVVALRKIVRSSLNLEMSLNPEIVKFTAKIKPDLATLVPERRQEITTEGGLDVIRHFRSITKAVGFLSASSVRVSLFIDPVIKQIKKAKESGAPVIELHTGAYANAKSEQQRKHELEKIIRAAQYAKHLKLSVSAGHGLDYSNTKAIAKIVEIEELNIGHAIISEAVWIGLKQAVVNMLKIMKV